MIIDLIAPHHKKEIRDRLITKLHKENSNFLERIKRIEFMLSIVDDKRNKDRYKHDLKWAKYWHEEFLEDNVEYLI